MNRNNSKRKSRTLSALSLALLVGAGAAYTSAYLTDTETTTNTFTIGDVSIDVEEPNYPGNDSDKVKDLVANEVVDKDVLIENSGKNEAIVFASVDVPMGEVVVFADKAEDIDTLPSNQELFTLIKSDGTFDNSKLDADGAAAKAGMGGKLALAGTMNSTNHNDKWSLLKTVFVSKDGKTSDTDNSVTLKNAAFTRYIYGYNEVLGKDNKSDPVFNKVMLNNIVEGYVDSTAKDIVVTGYAIQAANLEKVAISSVDGQHVVSIADETHESLTGADEVAGGEIKAGYDVSGILSDVYNVYIAQNNEFGESEDAKTNNAKDLKGNDREATETTKLFIDLSVDNENMRIGETALGAATVDTNLSEKGYTAAVSDGGVISINDRGNGVIEITAKKAGTAELSVTSVAANKDGKHAVAKVTITVTENSVEIGTPSTTNKTVEQTNGNRTAPAGN